MSLEDLQLEQPEDLGNAELSYLPEMSDDELLAMDADDSVFAPTPAEPEAEDLPAQTEDLDPAEPLDDEVQTPEVNAEVVPGEEVEPTGTEAPEPVTPAATPEVVPPKAAEPAEPVVDTQSFYEAVTKTFKANGRELQVTDPKDIIALMQQGANYDKKMAAIKPALQVHRTLEKAGLLDPEKISFMIDLYHGKPEAISKLAQDREIDLFSMDAKAEDYVPQAQMASVQEVEINSVISDLSNNPSFNPMFEALNAWDEHSQRAILDKPNMLYMFQEHKDLGIFDQITATIENERMLGRLRDVDNLAAYRLVGDRLFGGQPQQNVQPQPLAQSPVVQPVVAPIVAAPTPIPDPRVAAKQAAVNQKRSAAAAPRKVAQAATASDFNPLTVSDDDIDALIARQQRLM